MSSEALTISHLTTQKGVEKSSRRESYQPYKHHKLGQVGVAPFQSTIFTVRIILTLMLDRGPTVAHLMAGYILKKVSHRSHSQAFSFLWPTNFDTPRALFLQNGQYPIDSRPKGTNWGPLKTCLVNNFLIGAWDKLLIPQLLSNI